LLRVPSYYYPIPGIGAVLVYALLGYVFGLRDLTLLIFIVLWAPITVLLVAVLNLKFNPKVEQYYPGDLDLNPAG
jgi:hypothetical protein